MTGIKFGLNVNMHPEVATTSAEQVFHDQVDYACTAEDLGWDGVFAGQHFLSGSVIHLQPLPVMSYIAARTSRVDLGPTVALATLANPVELAEHYAALDAGANGRLVLGLGQGYRTEEFDAFGVEAPGRLARFRENVRIVDELLRWEYVTSDNDWCRLDGARLTYPTVQQPRPPIWMAGNSDQGVRRAARMADAWMVPPHTTATTVSRQLDMYRDERRRAGLEPPAVVPGMREVFCAEDASSPVLAHVRRTLAAKYARYHSWGQDTVQPEGEGFERPYADLADDRFAVGTPDECFEMLKAWIALGIDYIVIRTHWAGMDMADAVASVRALTTHVIPGLRELSE
ncbi:MAG: LLM class flavin-dependent oxidoreductase [Streptosporangiales bacterium]|nr:LLM class flavin-dependent oxidoreductase [Streptosporangiales bacterium]